VEGLNPVPKKRTDTKKFSPRQILPAGQRFLGAPRGGYFSFRRNFGSELKNERGIVLVITLLILSLLIGAGTGAIVSTQMDLKTSGNLKTGTQAFYNALAGLNHAWQELDNGDGSFDFNTVSSDVLPLFSQEQLNEGNYYTVDLTLESSNPKIIGITSTGTAPNNASRVVQARVHQTSAPPEQALTSNGNLVISGNIKLMGTCGGGHIPMMI